MSEVFNVGDWITPGPLAETKYGVGDRRKLGKKFKVMRTLSNGILIIEGNGEQFVGHVDYWSQTTPPIKVTRGDF